MEDPEGYFLKQVPNMEGRGEFSAEALSVTLQLINVLLLLAPMAVVCCFSRDTFTAKGYLFAVALADYGHIWATYRALGKVVFYDTSRWNDMIWGNVVVSGVLNVLRWLTLFGVFGPIVAPEVDGMKKTL
jgi:hypothetical protein